MAMGPDSGIAHQVTGLDTFPHHFNVLSSSALKAMRLHLSTKLLDSWSDREGSGVDADFGVTYVATCGEPLIQLLAGTRADRVWATGVAALVTLALHLVIAVPLLVHPGSSHIAKGHPRIHRWYSPGCSRQSARRVALNPSRAGSRRLCGLPRVSTT